MAYAEATDVPVEKTRAELEGYLLRRGANRFGYEMDEKGSTISFLMKDRKVVFILPLPNRGDKAFTHDGRSTRKVLGEAQQYARWEQACRSRWRALFLCVKAKIEAVEVGITSFDQEFMAHFVMANGRTIGETLIPKMAQVLAGSTRLTIAQNSEER